MLIVRAYDINGQHTLLDKYDVPMVFDDEQDAITYLTKYGFTEEDIETFSFEEPTEEDLTTKYYAESEEELWV